MKNRLESDKYIVYPGSGAGAGTFFVERKRDGALSLRATGTEAANLYKLLSRHRRRNDVQTFNSTIERQFSEWEVE